MEMIEYNVQETPSPSLKQLLVSAVARGDEMAAQELRLLLKMTPPEKLGQRRRGRCATGAGS